jgi:hypothetical protein
MRIPRAMPRISSAIYKAAYFCVLVVLAIAAAAQSQLPGPEKKSGEVFKNLKVLNDTPSDLLLPSMEFITSSLGVHCEYCHVEKAFEKDDKKPKQTAREMMRMVQEINSTRFQGKQEVTCYSCHRGSPKPLSVPVIAKAPPRLVSIPVPDDPADAPNQPSPPQVISKYNNARGGTSALTALTSLEERGTFESDSRGFPAELYLTRSGRSATVIHLPGADRITAFDGTSGWLSFPGRPARALSAAEVDAIRLNANFLFGLDLKAVFPEIKFAGFSKVGTADTVMLSGQRPGLPPVELYFDKTSGLLLRTVYYSPSALGLNPTQTDYSDYRNTGAVKIPFHWISSTPTGRFTIQILSARANGSVPENVFSKPAGQ